MKKMTVQGGPASATPSSTPTSSTQVRVLDGKQWCQLDPGASSDSRCAAPLRWPGAEDPKLPPGVSNLKPVQPSGSRAKPL